MAEGEDRGVTETRKPDYAVPGAYQPISLLTTLGKLLEAVIARRLSYLAEKHGLRGDPSCIRPERSVQRSQPSEPRRPPPG